MTKRSTKTAPKTTAPKSKAAPKAETAPSDAGKIAKTQLIEQVAERANLTRKQAGDAVNATLDAIVESLRAGKTVGLPGIGTFSVKATAARTGVRPGTSEKIQIPAGKKVSYKVATDLKSSFKD